MKTAQVFVRTPAEHTGLHGGEIHAAELRELPVMPKAA